MKYLIAFGGIVAIVVGYFVFAPSPTAVISQSEPVAVEETEQSIDEMVALKRESLPTALTDTVTLNDAIFFPRMRIMEYVYIAATPDAESLQTFVEDRVEKLCLELRDRYGSEITLRNSFEDDAGNVLRRIYLLQEDCLRFL